AAILCHGLYDTIAFIRFAGGKSSIRSSMRRLAETRLRSELRSPRSIGAQPCPAKSRRFVGAIDDMGTQSARRATREAAQERRRRLDVQRKRRLEAAAASLVLSKRRHT